MHGCDSPMVRIVTKTLATSLSLAVWMACARRQPSTVGTKTTVVPAPVAAPVEGATPECSADAEFVAWAIEPFSGGPLEYAAVPVSKVRELAPGIERRRGYLREATDKVALCEKNRCDLFDEALALRWVASLVPAIDDLVPYVELMPAKAAWFKEGPHIVLYVRSDWRVERPKPITCTPLDFVGDEHGHLVAFLDDKDRPVTVAGCFEALDLGASAVRTGSSCGHRGPDPDNPGRLRWYTSGGGEVYEESALLSSADDQGLVYNGVLVRATPRCRWLSVDRSSCPMPSCRTCQIVLDTSGTQGSAIEFRKIISGAPEPVFLSQPSCGPCLPDVQESWLPRLAAILRVPAFLEQVDDESALRFFRKKPDCERHVREHPGSRWDRGASLPLSAAPNRATP